MKNDFYTNYLINVDSRTDRMSNVEQRFAEINLALTRISAITGTSLTEEGLNLITKPNTEANWRSIQKIFHIFLQTNEDYCFVFEDDVHFDPGFRDFYDNFHANFTEEIDVLQFGFLTFKGRNDDRKTNNSKIFKARVRNFNLRIAPLVFYVFRSSSLQKMKIITKLSRYIHSNQSLVKMQKELNLDVPILHGFEPGTHGFIINRRMARLLLDFNLPMIMSADLVFMTLSTNSEFRIYRLGFPLAGQDDTAPSINGHASQEFNLADTILEK